MRDIETIRADLAAAMRACDCTALEDAVYAAFEANLPRALAPLLADALLLPWHFRHEDIATALQRMNDPRTVLALARGALLQPAYLAHDETNGLARKCVAALARIGNAEALSELAELARSEHRGCAELAARKLQALRRQGGDLR